MTKQLTRILLMSIALCTALSPHAAASPDSSLDGRIKTDEALIKSHPNVFKWHEHEALRQLYRQAGREHLEIEECDQMLQYRAFDENIINELSDGLLQTDPQKAVELLIARADKYKGFASVRSACLLRAADILAKQGQTQRAKSLYQLSTENNFLGTVKYTASANISLGLLNMGQNCQDPLKRIELCKARMTKARRGPELAMTDLLRLLYLQTGATADAMAQCEILLQENTDDGYVIDTLSNWALGQDSSKAVANLMKVASLNANLPCVRAACLLKVADMYMAQGKVTVAAKLYDAVLAEPSSAAEKYKTVARVSKELLGVSVPTANLSKALSKGVAETHIDSPPLESSLDLPTQQAPYAPPAQTDEQGIAVVTNRPDLEIGALQAERKALLEKILSAKYFGVGITNYMTAFDSIEDGAKSQEDESKLRERISSLSQLVQRQLVEEQALKTRPRLSVTAGDLSRTQHKFTDDKQPGTPRQIQDYVKQCLRIARMEWTPPPSFNEASVVIRFAIHAQGDVSDITIKTPSGLKAFDDSARQCVEGMRLHQLHSDSQFAFYLKLRFAVVNGTKTVFRAVD